MTSQEPVAQMSPEATDEYFRNLAERYFRQCQGRFMEAVAAANFSELTQALRDASAHSVALDLNARHPKSGETALHRFAAAGSRPALRLLFGHAANRDMPINHLLRDNQGRLPSKMACLFGEDPVMGRFLLAKEKQAAQKLGLKLRWVEPDPEEWNRRVHQPSKWAFHS